MRDSTRLYKAVSVIAERGWRKYGSLPSDPTKPVCILGALAAVDGLEDWKDVLVPEALMDVVGANALPITVPIWQFNDNECVTSDDAIAALQIAADIAATNERKSA